MTDVSSLPKNPRGKILGMMLDLATLPYFGEMMIWLPQTNRLERLDLSYNQLQQLDSSTLASMPRLLVLKANNNKLVCISSSLSELHQLEVTTSTCTSTSPPHHHLHLHLRC